MLLPEPRVDGRRTPLWLTLEPKTFVCAYPPKEMMHGAPKFCNSREARTAGNKARIDFALLSRPDRAGAMLAMPSTLANTTLLLFFAQHAQTFQFPPSSFHRRVPSYRTSSCGTFEISSSSSTTTAAAAPCYNRHDRRARQSMLQAGVAAALDRQPRRSLGTTVMNGHGGSSGDGGGFGGADGWFSEWKRTLIAASVALSVLSGSSWMCVGTPLAVLPAQASVAPSLMQDEKGYISIFEKVHTRY